MNVYNTLNNHFSQFIGLIALAATVLICFSAQAKEPVYFKIAELIASADRMDGQLTLIHGEVVGDVMSRQNGHAWFNVQDSTGIIGVWASKDLSGQILTAGDYNYQGDEIEVLGTFVKADLELSGETCVRAQSLSILKKGHRIIHKLNPVKARVVVILSILAGVLLLVWMSAQRRE